MRGTTPQERAKVLEKHLNKLFDPQGGRCNVIDMLTDLRHLCDARGWDFGELDRVAYDNYVPELHAGTITI
jgi:hypothetical protein